MTEQARIPVTEKEPTAPIEAAQSSHEQAVQLEHDPLFTPDRIEALKGSADPTWAEQKENGENRVDIVDYEGTHTREVTLGEGKTATEKTHLVSFVTREGRPGVASVYDLAFPEERRQKLENTGVHLNQVGLIDSIDPPTNGTQANQENKKYLPADEFPEEAISNNYRVHERPSGLLVAESRSYHSSKTHKSDEDNRLRTPGIDGPIPEKQRGIVEREIQLDGKPFIIAERPGSNSEKIESTSGPKEENMEFWHDERFDETTVSALRGPASITMPEGEEKDVNVEGYIGTNPEGSYMHVSGLGEVYDNGDSSAGVLLQDIHYSEEKLKQLREAGIDLEALAASLVEKGEFQVEAGGAQEGIHGQNTVLGNENLRLFGLFEGLGGVVNGDKASQAAAQAINEVYASRQAPMESEDEAAHYAAYALSVARHKASQTGAYTSGVFAKIENIKGKDYLVFANAGHSRLLLQHSDGSGTIQPLTTDQSTKSEMGRHAASNWLGPNLDKESDEYRPHTQPAFFPDKDEVGIVPLEDEDRILLGSAGVIGSREETRLTDKEIEEALDISSTQEAAQKLVSMGKEDDRDKSAIVVSVYKPE